MNSEKSIPTTIEYSVEGHTASITLNRPKSANALNALMIDELDNALTLAEQDEDVRVVVLGANGKNFCAGHDLKEIFDGTEKWAAMRSTVEGKWEHETEMYLNRMLRWRNTPLITIAAVQGACTAAGLMLACMCDLIIAEVEATFSNPVLRMNGAGVELLVEPWELGARKAKEFMFCAMKLTADDAERAGLVNRVAPSGHLDAMALAMATEAALVPPVTARAVKESINHTLDLQGQSDSWRHHFMVHQFVSATETATSAMAERTQGGMDAVKAETE